jgi:hypothetical protein
MKEIISNINSLEHKKKSFSESFLNEITDTSIDLSIDYSEIYIDDFIDNHIVKEIPIVKSVVGFVKGGIAINQIWFSKKLLTFIKTFNGKSIPFEKLNKFKEKLKSEPEFGKKIAEKLLVYIEKNSEINQTKIIANLFNAYVNEHISIEELNTILLCIDRLNPMTYNEFFRLEAIDFEINEESRKEIKRDFLLEDLIVGSGLAAENSSWFTGFSLTKEGRKFYLYGLKPLSNNK